MTPEQAAKEFYEQRRRRVCHYPDALQEGYVMLSFKKLEGQA